MTKKPEGAGEANGAQGDLFSAPPARTSLPPRPAPPSRFPAGEAPPERWDVEEGQAARGSGFPEAPRKPPPPKAEPPVTPSGRPPVTPSEVEGRSSAPPPVTPSGRPPVTPSGRPPVTPSEVEGRSSAPPPVTPSGRPPVTPSEVEGRSKAPPPFTPSGVEGRPVATRSFLVEGRPPGASPLAPAQKSSLAGSALGPATNPGATSKPAGRQVLSVGDLTRQIKGTLEKNFIRVCVKGEVSGFRGANPRGHLYFSIKDKEACLDVKVWATTAQRMKFKLRDGLSVVIEGSIDLYEPAGRYSLIVQRIDPAGEGALALAFQQLKERLAAEGLIGDKRKRPPRPLPKLPRRIGVITSVTGAALRDFLRVLHRRHPKMPVLICDARVQGDGASFEIVRALKRLARTDVDVIVITRGGGSIEDLWAFNEEPVARAIHACPVPVVSAIGHEVDFTIADFVADLRAPTPSAAAELIVPVLADLQQQLRTSALRLRKAVERQLLADRQRLHRSASRLSDPRRLLGQKRLHLSEQAERMVRRLRGGVSASRQKLKGLQDRLGRQRPEARLQRRRAELKKLEERLRVAAAEGVRRRGAAFAKLRIGVERASPKGTLAREHKRLAAQLAKAQALLRAQVGTARTRFHGLEGRLEAMSPLKVMARGYSVTFRSSDGHVVRSAADVAPGDAVSIRLARPDSDTLERCDLIQATVSAVKAGDER